MKTGNAEAAQNGALVSNFRLALTRRMRSLSRRIACANFFELSYEALHSLQVSTPRS